MAERVPSRREAIAYLRLVMLGALIGIPAAFLAAVFVALVHQIEHWLWDDLPSALGESSPPWYLVIGLPVAGAAVVFVAKALAYAASLGSGFRDGPVFPAIFLGVGLATFAVVWFDVSPTVAVAIGSAAGMAAMTRLLLTSSLFVTLLVGSAGPAAVPAAVLAAASPWLTMAAIDRRKAPAPVAAPSASAAPGAMHGPAADPDGVMVGERSLEDPAPIVGAGEAVLGRRVVVDDLTLIEGIDSDVAGTLRAAGVATWAALAASDAERQRSVLRTDDASPAGPDPTSWPEQAALALASRWADLKALQARVRVAP
jgi:predicted flap endonuclease-1-like 5' DNA nuclease